MQNEEVNLAETALAALRSHIMRTRELPSGYSLLFADHPSPVLALVDLLSLEGLSWSSIKIEIGERAGHEGDTVWVHFTGDDCVKEFLEDELASAQLSGRHRRFAR
jgi:hypothetical protein